MIWLWLIPLAIILWPLLQEITRTTVTSLQPSAPGELIPLPQGRMHMQWHGPKDGPVLVCVHGLTTSSYVWDGMLPGLIEAGYRVLTFDHYGRGYSDRPRGVQDAAFFRAELNNLLASQGVTAPVTLIGYSMGGAVVADYAATFPDRVSRVVMLAPAGMQPLNNGMIRFVRRTPVLGDWLMMAIYPEILRRGINAERALDLDVPGIAEKQLAELDVRGFVPSVVASLRGLLATPLEAEHRAIAVKGIPVHCIWGAVDDVIDLAQGKPALAEWNPQAAQDVIENGTHAIPYSHATEVVRLIRAQAG